MRAWVSGKALGVDALAIKDVAAPDPSDGHLLVRVTHGAVNFSDILMVADQYQVRPPRPFTPGQEIAGIVEEAAPATGFEPGDRIASKVNWGGFAHDVSVRADMAIRVPDKLSLAEGAALPVSYTTALVALDVCGKVEAGQTVLIHAAAGGLGLAAVEVAKARGARVIATAGAQSRLDIASARGADCGINYREEDWVDQVKDATNGLGADIILDPVGGKIGEDSLRCIARDGRLLIAGFSSGEMPRLAPHRLLLKRASAIGVYWNHDTDAKMLASVTHELERLIRAGHIAPLVDDRYVFDELPAALDDLQNRRVTGKLVLRIGAPEREAT
ncbi:MAG: NADPH:quinone oxidoreductase family protein [Silicimonas sp.]|nr:NADPH:quinone oxidoreductase family protein [Silicimonas sp.]